MGGYGIIPIFHLQEMEKVKFYFMHKRLNDTTGQLLEISTRYTQMEMGVTTPFWKMSFDKHHHLTTDTWVTHIWDYLHQCNV